VISHLKCHNSIISCRRICYDICKVAVQGDQYSTELLRLEMTTWSGES
jgi:hypothetical protein